MTPDRMRLFNTPTPPDVAVPRRAERPVPPPIASAPTVPAAAQQAAAAQAQRAAEAIAAANRRLEQKGSELTIEFEDALGRMIFRLVDRETREVVRQIPSEEVLAVARALADVDAPGVLVRADA